ncbi:MAG TPA: DUF1109 domain-containing protein [Burkholderiaceae bacterium]|nr:DUF1109 domain-containing protein [Burkholderiaceae bacterium]
MNTDDLVSLLSNGAEAVDSKATARRFLVAVAAGTAAALTLSAGLLGVRSTPLAESSMPMFWAREAFCASLGVAGLLAMHRLARPGMRLGFAPVGLAAPLVAMWLLAAVALLGADPERRSSLIFGQTAGVCPFLIALVSTPVFAALLWMMKGLAPTRLALAGATCGFAAGAIGALAYTLHCPELAAPFLGIWYVLGMLIPTAVGAWLGPRVLRW